MNSRLPFMVLLLAPCFVSLHALAQEPTDYAGWVGRAQTLKNDPAVAEAAAKESVAWKKSEIQAKNSEKVAAAFMQAAALAPNEAAKFDALMSAAFAWENGYATKSQAYEAFAAASKIKTVAGDKRGVAALGAARNLYAWKDVPKDKTQSHDLTVRHYLDVAEIAGAKRETLASAHEELAHLYGREVPNRKPDVALVATHWEKAAAHVEKPETAELWLSFASVNATKAEPSPQMAALLDRIYPRRIELKKQLTSSPQAALDWEAALREDWARGLAKRNAFDRALAVWKLNADNTNLEEKRRFEAFERIAKQQLELKRYADVFKTWESAAKLPNASYARAQKIAFGRADVFVAQKNEQKARETYQSLVAHPAAKPDDASVVWLNVGLSHKRERDALRAAKAAPALIESAEKAAISAFASMLMPGASLDARYTSFRERAIIEAENKRYEAAQNLFAEVFKDVNAPAALTWAVGRDRATVYGQAKQFALAAEMLSGVEYGMTWSGLQYHISQPTLNLGEQLYRASIEAKDWVGARKLTDLFGKWGVNYFDRLLRVTRIDIGEGKIEAARKAVAQMKTAYLGEAQKKELAALVALLPPEPTAPATP